MKRRFSPEKYAGGQVGELFGQLRIQFFILRFVCFGFKCFVFHESAFGHMKFLRFGEFPFISRRKDQL